MQNFKTKLYSNISIHTLVKRVTFALRALNNHILHFNSHSRKESDRRLPAENTEWGIPFQFTLS